MKSALSTFFTGLVGQIVPTNEELEPYETHTSIDLLDSVEKARRDWLSAKAYFDCVTDSDLIDMAIYNIEAAEKRYMYLLKVARTKGIRLDQPQVSHF